MTKIIFGQSNLLFVITLCGQRPRGYGQLPMEHQLLLEFLFFVSLCSFMCLQAVYQLSGPVCKST